MNNINILPNIADIFAIPFFLISSIYFYKIKNKNIIEYILLIFNILGFILDTIFTYLYFNLFKE